MKLDLKYLMNTRHKLSKRQKRLIVEVIEKPNGDYESWGKACGLAYGTVKQCLSKNHKVAQCLDDYIVQQIQENELINRARSIEYESNYSKIQNQLIEIGVTIANDPLIPPDLKISLIKHFTKKPPEKHEHTVKEDKSVIDLMRDALGISEMPTTEKCNDEIPTEIEIEKLEKEMLERQPNDAKPE